ncbi:response regulator [Taibaiella koreensis]|uniref:response regulator n=1 Tax=Taibaiella koreensis TaxID=1268548 RepID=UPI000E59D338|nr:response regulator [Taibaiella koreensis]
MNSPKQIMVADDDSSILDMVGSMLEFAGYSVVHSPTAAMALTPQRLPDLFLLDVWIAGADGREVCRQLKKQEHTRDIPVILFSASRGIEDSARRAGADDFLSKPFQMTDLLEKIGELIA